MADHGVDERILLK